MISLLLPIGCYSFFARACLNNVLETCGAVDQLDFVFLIPKQVPHYLSDEFDRLRSSGLRFRVIRAPISTYVHLELLDWAVANADLSDWIIVQHNDLFWIKDNWLKVVLDTIAQFPNDIGLSWDFTNHGFRLNNKPTAALDDCFGVYNRKLLQTHNLRFLWGNVSSLRNLMSPEMKKALKERQLSWSSPIPPNLSEDEYNVELEKHFVDGSRLMQMEVAIRFPKLVHRLVIRDHFVHLMQIFRITHRTKIVKNTLTCRERFQFQELLDSSYMTSFLIDKQELTHQHFPWGVLTKLWYVSHANCRKHFSPVSKYASPNVLGHDSLGIRTVNLFGRDIDLAYVPRYIRKATSTFYQGSALYKEFQAVDPNFASHIDCQPCSLL